MKIKLTADPSWKVDSHSADQESTWVYGTQKFIMFTRSCHCPYPEPDESSPHIHNVLP